MGRRLSAFASVLCLLSLLSDHAALRAQQPAPLLNSTERERAKEMLDEIKRALRSDYYDATFGGRDLNQHFKEAEAKLETARSQGHAYAIIAQALIDFDDSHTFFVPPSIPTKHEYGWTLSVVGDACYVTAVRPGSDAAAQGLMPGDRVLQYDAFPPERGQLWKAQYLYHVLSPRRALKVVVQSPGGAPRAMELAAKVTPLPREQRVSLDELFDGGSVSFGEGAKKEISRAVTVGDVAVWKLSSFDFKSEDVDRLFDEVVKGAGSLILDVRGNPGGFVKTLERVAGRLFDRDVRIGDVKGRKGSRPTVAKKGKKPFGGKVVVLVDSDSASAAEVIARVIQLEKRGIVVGDRSSGSVMEGRFRLFAIQVPDASELVMIPYGASITAADLIMADGRSLEHVGVTPDEVVLPTADDLRNGRDPALARAAALLGQELSPAAAGALFPVEWK